MNQSSPSAVRPQTVAKLRYIYQYTMSYVNVSVICFLFLRDLAQQVTCIIFVKLSYVNFRRFRIIHNRMRSEKYLVGLAACASRMTTFADATA